MFYAQSTSAVITGRKEEEEEEEEEWKVDRERERGGLEKEREIWEGELSLIHI